MVDIEFKNIVRDKLVAVAFPGSQDMVPELRKSGARDVLLLRLSAPRVPVRHSTHVVARMRRAMHLTRNNCDVAILNSASALSLFNKIYFARPRFETLLVPMNLSLLAALPGIVRYAKNKRLEVVGKTRAKIGGKSRAFLVLRNNITLPSNRRLHGPTGLTPLEILKSLKGIDYVLLRWVEDVEQGKHISDLDILVADDALAEMRAALSWQVGTFPLDVYAESGREGFNMLNVPYFVPAMARQMLDSATTRKSGIRVMSGKWQFLSMAYHLVFHGKSKKIPPRTVMIDETLYPKARHCHELARLAARAKMPVPQSYDDLDAALREAQVFPGRDLIGFYSRRNPFVRERYLGRETKPAGLSVFFVRDFGEGLAPIPKIEKTLRQHFRVLAQGAVDDGNREVIFARVRGGNWFDKAHNAIAPPVYWFVCWDEKAHSPSGKIARDNPGWDNANMALKFQMRADNAASAGARNRVLHASDNTSEALEHIAVIGIAGDPKLSKAIGELGLS